VVGWVSLSLMLRVEVVCCLSLALITFLSTYVKIINVLKR
jgi:hypothetical protein